jgi:hypothetical protein
MANNDPVFGNNSFPDTERIVAAAFSGSSQNIGSALTVNPFWMCFDNQSTVTCVVYWNGVQWKTFVAGEALVVDFSTNKSQAATRCPKVGDQFSLIGSGGTGQFSISAIYAG